MLQPVATMDCAHPGVSRDFPSRIFGKGFLPEAGKLIFTIVHPYE
jgi:hypothetical protein